MAKIRAFTLTEIIVVLVIIVLLAVLGVGGYRAYQRFTLASDTIVNLRNFLRLARVQTYTVREQPGEYTFGIGVRFYKTEKGWRFVVVKFVTPVVEAEAYKEYPSGPISQDNVVPTSVGQKQESLETPADMQLVFYKDGVTYSCDDLLILFEVPISSVHFYCQQAGIYQPFSVTRELRITYANLVTKRLVVSKLGDVYIQ